MAKQIEKIIQSKTAPKSNNVLWDDGENLKINRNGKWESVLNSKNTQTENSNTDNVIIVTYDDIDYRNKLGLEALRRMHYTSENIYDYGSVIVLRKGVVCSFRYMDWDENNTYMCICYPGWYFDYETNEAGMNWTINAFDFKVDDEGSVIKNSVEYKGRKILEWNA